MYFQITVDDLPAYHREVIKGSPTDSIFIRLQQLKYDKRRVAVLHARLKSETENVRRLEANLAQLQEAYDTLRDRVQEDIDSSHDTTESDSEEEVQMWPDGQVRKIRRIV